MKTLLLLTALLVPTPALASVAFRATDARLELPHSEAISPADTGAFSVSLWYKPEAIMSNPLPRLWGKGANYIAVMGNYDNGTNSEHHRVALEVTNGESHTEFWARTTRLQDGNWYHIVVSFDEDDCYPKMHISGVKQTVHATYPWCDKDNQTLSGNTKPVTIGNRDTFERPAAGEIKDVVYWNRELSLRERQNTYKGKYASKGMVYHLLMNEGQGSVANDSSGNNLHGALFNTEWE